MSEPFIDQGLLARLPEPLLAWFRLNARDLPWRHARDPYRIWISEIMLQQTRVAAVLGYYDRFLKAFPTVQELAQAPEDRLMKCWEGLGYYSRARNLQKAAKVVTEQYAGQFPDTYEGLLTLPGIGEYTAGAIASAAFDRPVPAVDGNVLRVVSRICDCDLDILDTKNKKLYRDAVGAIMPDAPEDIRIFNQAMMELGAVVCVPNGPPKCDQCPASTFCQARQRGTIGQLPVKTPKKPRRLEEKTVFVLLRDGKAALRKRGADGLLAGLWEYPNLDGTLSEAAVPAAVAELGLTVRDWKQQLNARHIFTHVEWHMTGYVLEVSGVGNPDLVWADRAGLEQLAVPSAFAKYHAAAKSLLDAAL